MRHEFFRKPRLLIVVDLPEPPALPLPLLEAFKDLEVVLLGHYALPEQTSPEQGREEFQTEAESELEVVAQQLEDQEVETERNLAFTSDLAKTIDQTIQEENCDAVLAARPADEIRKVLVPLHRADQQPVAIADFIGGLVGESDTGVTLLRFPESDEQLEEDWAEDYVRHFTEVDVPEDQLHTETCSGEAVVDEVVERAGNHDLVVIGECRPSVKERIFGEIHESIMTDAPCPVIVVVRKPEENEDCETD